MPTYEYQCTSCDHQWEEEKKISAPVTKKCPKCGKLKAKRLISGTSFLLKGSGWFSDGY